MMYHGRSIGRMLEWLRELTTHADHLIFHPGGKITLWDKVVIEKTEWDEYDNPTFIFVNESESEKEWRERGYLRMREREFTCLYHAMHPATLDALIKLEDCGLSERSVRKDSIPQTHFELIKLGLAKKEENLIGWDDDAVGSPLFDINVEISPQGRGFLESFKGEEWKALR